MNKVRALFTAVVLVAGTQAYAMPNLDGTYNCSSDQGSSPVTIVTKNNQLFLVGLGSGTTMADNGLICDNKSESKDIYGTKLMSTSTCDDKSVAVVLSLKVANTPNMDVKVSVAQTAPDKVQIAVFVGDLANPAAGTTLALTCSK